MTEAASPAPVGHTSAPLSYRAVLKHPEVKILAAARFASKMAGSTLSYGIMVFLAAAGASQLEISAASSASYLAALLFGLQGGTLADSGPKRRILAIGFVVQALLCLVLPVVFGTDIVPMLVLIFLTSALTQVISPGLKSIVAVVSSPAEVATTGALVNVLGSIGSAIGSSFIAPLLIKYFGINAILATAGILFLIGAMRIYKLPKKEQEESRSLRESISSVNWKPRALSLGYNADWIMAHRPVASMLLVGILCAALFEGLNSLLPVYVREVLNEDPANSIYIFAPAGIGYLIGAVGGPRLIHRFGERRLAFISLIFMIVGAFLLGAIDTVAPFFARFSPLRILELFGVEFSDLVLAAGVIVIPANFGSTAASQSVQVYINRHVPVVEQGGIFGLQQVQQNAFNLASVFLLGVVATVTGPQYVFFIAPLVVGAAVLLMVRYSFRHTGQARLETGEAAKFLVEERPEDEIIIDNQKSAD
jgi:MFS family permease